MHPRVEKLPPPAPDYRRFLAAVARNNPGPIPLIELAVDLGVVGVLLGEPDDLWAARRTDPRCAIQGTVQLLHRLGYDVVKVSAPIPFDIGFLSTADTGSAGRTQRNWQDQHTGPIQTMDDFESFRWPTRPDVDFTPLEHAAQVLPEGMKLIGFAGGVLEFATYLMGLERLMFAVYDAPDLLAAVIDRVGRTIQGVFEAYCQMDSVCAIWLGDDLGSKNGLLVGPDLLRDQVFPWYRRFRELAHRHNRPFLLHSCGNIAAVLPDLINEVGIDAKHSFEDGILPVEQFIDAWGRRVGTLGGIDVNLLTQGPEDAIVARTLHVLEHAAPGHGYVCGSGNSIPSYVPPDHYLALVETVARFNARH